MSKVAMGSDENDFGPWSRYWSTGALHSCISGEDGNVFSQEFWEGFFSQVEGSVRILDIGTGNGLLPMLAVRCLGSRAKVYAIDAAQIRPDSAHHEELAHVEFMSGVACEKLPFDSGSVDVVTAQFALEYSRLPLSLKEVCRVLAPDGQAGLVVHACDSRLSAVSRAQLQQIEWLRRPAGFFDAARRMLRVLHSRRETGLDHGSHARARERYNEIATELIGKLEGEGVGDVLARAAIVVQRALAAAAGGPVTGEVAGFEAMISALDDEALRLEEQLRAARTPEQLQDIGSILEASGMKVVLGPLHQRGELMAYTVVAKR